MYDIRAQFMVLTTITFSVASRPKNECELKIKIDCNEIMESYKIKYKNLSQN